MTHLQITERLRTISAEVAIGESDRPQLVHLIDKLAKEIDEDERAESEGLEELAYSLR